jgi:4-amino-4-deoxychorismate lyase
MSRLIESIQLNNGRFLRLQYHQQRMNHTFTDIFQTANPINIFNYLSNTEHPKIGLHKCRVIYEKEIESVEFIPYQSKAIKSLKIVHDDKIEYEHKFEDRSQINLLFENREQCDDILIVKNGFITDSSYSNIIFFDGLKWITPNSPLLKGTMRQMLLDAAEIKEQPIAIKDISSFKSFRLINAMLGFDGSEIEVSQIVF